MSLAEDEAGKAAQIVMSVSAVASAAHHVRLRPWFRALAADEEIAALHVVDCVANLVAKSLVTADSGGAETRYRLLETTRAYALEKLLESGEFDAAARRHAEHYRDLFERAEAEVETRPTDEWLAHYVPMIDNLRAALGWAFSSGGDTSIGVAFTTAAVPLWMHLSLMEECRGRAEQALGTIAAGADRDARREMKLLAALGTSLVYTRGDSRRAFLRPSGKPAPGRLGTLFPDRRLPEAVRHLNSNSQVSRTARSDLFISEAGLRETDRSLGTRAVPVRASAAK